MNNNFNWDESQDNDDFRDIPEEVGGKDSPPLPASARVQNSNSSAIPSTKITQNALPETLEETFDEILEDLDEEDDYTEVLSDARLRLEQGRLYEMIMNHSLFQDVDSDPRAIKNVQREIKKFAKDRMEILLGMKQEKLTKDYQEYNAGTAQFNSLEVELLKQLALKMSQGKTAEVSSEEPKKNTLSSIAGTKQKPAPKPKTLTKSPQVPVQRAKPKPQQSVLEDDGYEGLPKHPSQMTTDELIEYNRKTSERQAGRKAIKPANVMPQATYEQEEMIYSQRAMAAAPAVSTIMALLNNQRKT